jgi:hypothetical protein
MILAPPFLRVVEHVDRRVLGAFQFVDAVTRLPVTVAAKVGVRRAALVNGAADTGVPLHEGSVQIRQTQSAFHTILRAPFFDAYAVSFLDPQNPPETLNRRLRLRLAVTNAGPHTCRRSFNSICLARWIELTRRVFFVHGLWICFALPVRRCWAVGRCCACASLR